MAKLLSTTAHDAILAQTKSDSKVRFSFKYCKLKRNFCLTELQPTEIEKFFKKLWENEDLTTHQFCNKGRTNWWFSIYSDSSESYKILKQEFPAFDLFGHFWITWIPTKGTFRIMGTRKNETIYVLLVDHEWKIDKEAHK